MESFCSVRKKPTLLKPDGMFGRPSVKWTGARSDRGTLCSAPTPGIASETGLPGTGTDVVTSARRNVRPSIHQDHRSSQQTSAPAQPIAQHPLTLAAALSDGARPPLVFFHVDEWRTGAGGGEVGGGALAELWCTYAAPIAAVQMERRGHFVIISGTSHGWNKMGTAHSVPCFHFIFAH